MARIHPLPALLVNQIAAGEVVERPASVVKELLENALDAGSTRIDVEVAQGGIDLVRVVDDGCGIHAEDLPLAFASHATSKLASAEDLFRIGTLGFRGEALASVGSIAQVTLQSRPADQDCGAEISCHGGKLGPVVPWNGSPGTRIEVRHLFFSTPARRKFLKGVATEMGHVAEAFTRLALSHTGVHWTLSHNGKLIHEVPGSLSLLDRIGVFFGAELCNSLYLVEVREGQVKLSGYVGDPFCDRANTQIQYLFLNGRWVRDRGLFQAVQDAYKGLLMTGRYPVAFLFLEVPPDQVDVNVHPAKTEVRFRDRDALYQLVQRAVRERLQAADLTARMQLNIRKEFVPGAGTGLPAPQRTDASAERPPAPEPQGMPAAPRTTAPVPPFRAFPDLASAAVRIAPTPRPAAPAELFSPSPARAQALPDQGSPERGPERSAAVGTDGPRAMQVLECYLVVEVPPDEVLFIDQHALHERILYEQFQERLRSGSMETQLLLIPEPVTLPPAQAALVLGQREALAELGLTVEDFGGGTILLTGYPAVLGKRSPKGILEAVVDHLATRERVPSREQLLNDLASVMACHAAVRVGDRLTSEEITALLAQREVRQNSHHCPHGRPTSLRFSRHDLERHFKRG